MPYNITKKPLPDDTSLYPHGTEMGYKFFKCRCRNCKDANNLSNQIRRTAILKWIFDMKASLGCSNCTEKHPACIDFHHKNREDKSNCVSRMMACSKKKILEEIAKCDVLCSNCHRKHHYEEKLNNKTLESHNV